MLTSELGASGCAACPLDRASLQHPKMLPTGPEHSDVYVLGEAPGADEDAEGEQFVGKSGQFLRKAIPRGDKARWNNTIRCRPPGNRTPTTVEVSCCRALQREDIERSKPKLILAVGGVPTHWLLGQDKITAWRGRVVPVRVGTHRCWAMPVLHPAYVLRVRHKKGGDAIEQVFRDDVARAFELAPTLRTPVLEDASTADAGLVYCLTPRDVEAAFADAASWPEMSLDIETNRLQPYARDSRILSVALSNYETTYAFPLDHRESTFTPSQRARVEEQLLALLLSGKKVIAHNSKFEIEWLTSKFGPGVVHRCAWEDTLSQAYVLDEREGAKSLEALTIMHLGFNVKALNKVNVARINDLPIKSALRYNAHDAKYTFPLYRIQRDLLKQKRLLKVYTMHNERVAPLAYAQLLGMIPDTKRAAELAGRYEKDVVELDEKIQKHPDVVKFKTRHREFNPASPKQLKEFFHDQLGFEELQQEDESFSTDEAVLKQVKHPVAALILQRREVSKLAGTYVTSLTAGGKHIHDDGLVHTTYNHARTGTSRTSSEDPNLQNIPVRTAEGKLIRSVFVAPKQHWLVSCDYGQIEARVIGMASRDRFLCNALWTGYDIHMEWAEKIVRRIRRKLDKAGLKQFRSVVKNKWTFPLFFGAALKSVCGYLELEERQLAPLYEEFWDTFADVRNWQRDIIKFYQQHGYVELLTRRRRHAPLAYNEILNTPIQGTASEIVIAASVAISRRAYLEKLPQLQFRLNVHDDLSFYLPDATLERDIATIAEDMCKPRFDFINVPLTIEVKVGRNWGEQEEVATYSSVDWGHRRV